MRLLIAAFFALFLAVAPNFAHAAGATEIATTEIDCIIDRTPAPLKSEVEGIAAKVIADSDATPGGETMIANKLDAQLKSCVATHHWGSAKSQAAMDYAVATLLATALKRQLAEKQVSVPALDRVVTANPAVFAPKRGEPAASEEQRQKVLADARAAGLPIDTPGLDDLILSYLGSVAVRAEIVNEFEGA